MPDFWRDVLSPAVWNSVNPFNKSVGELVWATVPFILMALRIYSVAKKRGLKNRIVKTALQTIAVGFLVWFGLLIFNLISIPFDHWKNTEEKLRAATQPKVATNVEPNKPSQGEQRKAASKSEALSTRQVQSNIKQESKGDNSPNIVGSNNQVNSPVIINPEKGWQKLTDKEVSEAVSQLTQFAGTSAKIDVTSVSGFADAGRVTLARQIEHILKTAQWNVKAYTPHRMYNGIPDDLRLGVLLLTRERTKAAETLADILARVLGKNNFSGHLTDKADDKYNVEIRVWFKPE